MTSPKPNVTPNDDAARAARERETGMSDRTPSSVRAGVRTADGAAPTENAPGESTPVSSTQAIPTTGSQAAQTAGGPTSPGTPAQPGGGPVGAPPVPPPTGAAPAASGTVASSASAT